MLIFCKEKEFKEITFWFFYSSRGDTLDLIFLYFRVNS